MQAIRTISLISLIIACYYFIYYLYMGITNPIPSLGDSWDYHIPIATTILDGSFLAPSDYKLPHWYYPGSSEAFLSFFIMLGIPLTLSNMLPIVILFFCCLKLALTFGLKKYYALLFAVTFVTLNVVVRWMNAVSIDMWVAVFFTLSLILLENPKKSLYYFAQLGFVFGMLIGSKYTTLYFIIILLVFYLRNLIRYVNFSRLLAFALPFGIFGLFWYIRNFIFTGNPFYPLARLGFEGPSTFHDTVWLETLRYPLTMFNAAFGEYKLWIFSVLIAVVILFYQYVVKRKFVFNTIHKLFLLGILNFICYFSFPTSAEPWIMVSSFRYSLPAFIPLILGVFLLAAKYKKEELIGYIAIANMINVLSMTYYPKLVIAYLPLSLFLMYFFTRSSRLKE